MAEPVDSDDGEACARIELVSEASASGHLKEEIIAYSVRSVELWRSEISPTQASCDHRGARGLQFRYPRIPPPATDQGVRTGLNVCFNRGGVARKKAARLAFPSWVQAARSPPNGCSATVDVAAAIAVPVVASARLLGDAADQGSRNTTYGGTHSRTTYVSSGSATYHRSSRCSNPCPLFGCSAGCERCGDKANGHNPFQGGPPVKASLYCSQANELYGYQAFEAAS